MLQKKKEAIRKMSPGSVSDNLQKLGYTKDDLGIQPREELLDRWAEAALTGEDKVTNVLEPFRISIE